MEYYNHPVVIPENIDTDSENNHTVVGVNAFDEVLTI